MANTDNGEQGGNEFVDKPLIATGTPPIYQTQFLGSKYIYKAGQTYSFVWSVIDALGGLVPPPSSVVVSLLDTNYAPLNPPLPSAEAAIRSSDVPAASITIGGTLTLPAVPGSYFVELLATADRGDGTGVLTITGSVVIVLV